MNFTTGMNMLDDILALNTCDQDETPSSETDV